MKPLRYPFEQTRRFTATLLHMGGKRWLDVCSVAKEPLTARHRIVGMTPVIASVDGKALKTTGWNDTKSGSQFLPVPDKCRGSKASGDQVLVELLMDRERILGSLHPLE